MNSTIYLYLFSTVSYLEMHFRLIILVHNFVNEFMSAMKNSNP